MILSIRYFVVFADCYAVFFLHYFQLLKTSLTRQNIGDFDATSFQLLPQCLCCSGPEKLRTCSVKICYRI